MASFHENMKEYKKQLNKEKIKKAYRGLMDYFQYQRQYFKKNNPNYFVSGPVYYGFMEMTYFYFTPQFFRDRKLKIAIVFVHDTFTFEVWLAGNNKQVQMKYWNFFKEINWSKYHIPSTTKGVDSIIENILDDAPDFRELDVLTKQIETETMNFIKAIENFLSEKYF